MKYHFLLTLGDDADPDLCTISDSPDGIGFYDHYPAMGMPVREYMPVPAVLHISNDYPGMVTTSLLGNLLSYLIVSEPMKDVMVRACPEGSVETFPVALHSHRGDLHSSDYWIVNPLTILDCLDLENSTIKYSSKGKIVSIKEFVFVAAKLVGAPGLFRVKEDVFAYVISDEVLQACRAANFTNLLTAEIRQTGT